MDAAAIIAIITVSFTGLTALITTVFQSSSLSRCTEIDCLCCHCIRKVMDKEEMKEMDEIISHTHKDEVVARPVQK
jgi:hypothetical protein